VCVCVVWVDILIIQLAAEFTLLIDYTADLEKLYQEGRR